MAPAAAGITTSISRLCHDSDRTTPPVEFENNTLYGDNGLFVSYLSNYGYPITNRNNIIWTEGSGKVAITVVNPPVIFASDYNDLFVTNGAIAGSWGGIVCPTLADWHTASAQDASSLSINPLFVDPDGTDDSLGDYYGDDDDFHVQSTAGSCHGGTWTNDLNNSPCIDAGDPGSDYALEPAPNGGRVNIGAYGNTACASKSPYQDTDGDGMPDWWEILYGLDLSNPADAGQDADGDWFTNLQEFQVGTDPPTAPRRYALSTSCLKVKTYASRG